MDREAQLQRELDRAKTLEFCLRTDLANERERADSNWASIERIKEKFSQCANDLKAERERAQKQIAAFAAENEKWMNLSTTKSREIARLELARNAMRVERDTFKAERDDLYVRNGEISLLRLNLETLTQERDSQAVGAAALREALEEISELYSDGPGDEARIALAATAVGAELLERLRQAVTECEQAEQHIAQLEAEIERLKPSILSDSPRFAREMERNEQLEAENASLRNQLGDNLCYLPDQGDHAAMIQALPEAEVAESCRRYQAQMRAERGVFTGGKTIAQLEQDNARLRTALEQAGKVFERLTRDEAITGGRPIHGNTDLPNPAGEFYKGYNAGIDVAFQKSAGIATVARKAIEAALATPGADAGLAALRSHKWTGRQKGGNPAEAGSYEWVRYCDVCGMEDTCEDPLSPCPGEDAEPGKQDAAQQGLFHGPGWPHQPSSYSPRYCGAETSK